MSAQLQPLTDAERARVRRELYAEKVQDWSFIREALDEADSSEAQIIMVALATGDGLAVSILWNNLIRKYIESELVEEAEREFLESKL